MKITDDFHYKWKPSHAYHKIDTFRGEQDEWDTKEGPGKSCIACAVAPLMIRLKQCWTAKKSSLQS